MSEQLGARDVVLAVPRPDAQPECLVYRYVPPAQIIAHAVTFIEDVLIEFSLRFTGSLTVICPADEADQPMGDRPTPQLAGTVLHRIADGLIISSIRVDAPVIESNGGHRFTQTSAVLSGPRTRRFVGDCEINLPGRLRDGQPTVSGTLGYTLDVRAVAPSDPPIQTSPNWLARHENLLASIGAVVLAPVPVAVGQAARLFTS